MKKKKTKKKKKREREREVKGKGESKRYIQLNAEFQRTARRESLFIGYEEFNHTKNQIYNVVQSLFPEYSGIKLIMNHVMGKSNTK